MHTIVLRNNLNRLNHFLQTTGIPHIDDPVLVFGDNEAVDVLHACSENVISHFEDSSNEELCMLIEDANKMYEQIIIINKVLAIGFLASVYSAISKIYINRLDDTLKIGIVVPAYNEVMRMMPQGQCDKGQNALVARVNQYLWLFSDRDPSKQRLLFVDDLSTDDTKDKLEKGIKSIPGAREKGVSVLGLDDISSSKYKHYLSKYPALAGYRQSVKGGSVYFGLLWMMENKYDYVFFIDFDLTHLLEHAGLLINTAQLDPDIGMVNNSRRTPLSKGYCENEGNMITALFQSINNELLNSKLTDVNTGFKLINMKFFRDISSQITNLSLSLDSELIMLCLRNGYSVVENSGICFHQYVEGKQGVNRDYGMMLKSAMEARMNHSYNDNSPAPLYFEMEKKGFYNLVKILETLRTQTQSNQEAIQLYRRRLSQ